MLSLLYGPTLTPTHHLVWCDHKRWRTEGNCFFTKFRINCISLEKRYLYFCTKFMFTSGTPFKKMNKDTPQVKADLGPIIALLLAPLQPRMPSCRFCCTLCKLLTRPLYLPLSLPSEVLLMKMCTWFSSSTSRVLAQGTPFWRACSGHSTPNIIIHFLSPFLFHFFSSHWLLFSFIALRVYYLFVYFYLTALRRVVSQYLLNEWFSKPSNNLNFTFAGWWKGNLFLRNYGAIW